MHQRTNQPRQALQPLDEIMEMAQKKEEGKTLLLLLLLPLGRRTKKILRALNFVMGFFFFSLLGIPSLPGFVVCEKKERRKWDLFFVCQPRCLFPNQSVPPAFFPWPFACSESERDFSVALNCGCCVKGVKHCQMLDLKP